MKLQTLFLLFFALIAVSCREVPIPKQRAYIRMDFPEKTYTLFESSCNFSFEYPVYGEVRPVTLRNAEPCWYDIYFKDFKATIHITYKPLESDISVYIEDIRRIVNKHIIKADDIVENPIYLPEKDIYGLLYDISGNTASAVNFYITDSASAFVSGALYFNMQTNIDSLAPAIEYFRKDIIHLVESFRWE